MSFRYASLLKPAALVREAAVVSSQIVARLGVPVVRPTIRRTLPHDPGAFTQGLHFTGAQLYESTGLVGRSTVRRLNPADGTVCEMVAVPGDHGEGIAVHDNRLYQLSWQSGIVRVYRIPDLQFVQEFRHEGEGWGLTAGPDGLIMSDGSSTLQVRDDMFHLRGTIRVRSNRVRVTLLNDLAYAQGFIYSNVWGQPYICEIEYPVGRLTRIVDCSALVAAAAPTDPNAVFNGIAYNPDAGTFFVTGKFWPRLFEIEFGC